MNRSVCSAGRQVAQQHQGGGGTSHHRVLEITLGPGGAEGGRNVKVNMHICPGLLRRGRGDGVVLAGRTKLAR